jgi:Tfp pilus assembly protein PilN
MRAVNLLPSDAQQPRGGDLRLPLLLGAGGLAAITVASVSLWLPSSSAVGEKHDELASIEAAIARIPSSPSTSVAQAAMVRERTDRVAAFRAAVSGRIAFDALLRDISLVLPGDVWLTGVMAEAPEPAAAPAPAGSSAPAGAAQTVTIEGASFSYPSVARTLVRLSTVPSLTNVRLASSDLVEPQAAAAGEAKKAPKQRPYITFSIVASVPAGAGS